MKEPKPGLSSLPYTDSKPVGAADFYFVINATFRFIERRFGLDGLRRYWQQLGESYYAPVSAEWKRGGLAAIASYWRAFFQAEPGGNVEVKLNDDSVVIDVRACPAIRHLREHGRQIIPCYCQHCYYVSEAIAAAAGYAARIEGGDGSCRQVFRPHAADMPPQQLTLIKEVK